MKNQRKVTPMKITLKELKIIKATLAKYKPVKPALAVDRTLSTKEVIMSLAPELSKMKSKGFTTNEMLAILEEHKVSIKGATLNRYLAAYKEDKAQASTTPPEDSKTTPFTQKK